MSEVDCDICGELLKIAAAITEASNEAEAARVRRDEADALYENARSLTRTLGEKRADLIRKHFYTGTK